MKINKSHIGVVMLCILSIFLFPARMSAQKNGTASVQEYAKRAQDILHYRIIDGDTVFVENIRPSYVWGWREGDRKNWRKYYRLVHNFSKSYPYAKLAGKVVRKTDSVFIADKMTNKQKQKYVDRLQRDIIRNFESVLRNMTISQGQLLIKLIDREVGMSSYSIINDYKNGIAAKFWQGIAKMFKSDLKKSYDPTGADRDIEELVHIWERGDFPYLYYSIFGKYPKVPVMPSKFR